MASSSVDAPIHAAKWIEHHVTEHSDQVRPTDQASAGRAREPDRQSTEAGTTTAPGPAKPGEPTRATTRGAASLPTRITIAVFIAAMVAMWGYAFFWPQQVPGRLDDTSFPTAAEPVCHRHRVELDGLPRSISVRTPEERGDLVDQGTSILAAMVNELRGLIPTTEPAQSMVTEWLADWDTYLEDRRDYAQRLRGDANARFYVTQSDRDNKQITQAVDRFAAVNAMPSCGIPNDVG